MNADIDPAPAAQAGQPAGQPPRRRSLAALLATALRHPLVGIAALLAAVSLPFGLARSRRSVLRNGWILGDKDR